MRSTSNSGLLVSSVSSSKSAAAIRGSRPDRNRLRIGAPGQACPISSHLVRATRICMLAACRAISETRAVFRSRGHRKPARPRWPEVMGTPHDPHHGRQHILAAAQRPVWPHFAQSLTNISDHQGCSSMGTIVAASASCTNSARSASSTASVFKTNHMRRASLRTVRAAIRTHAATTKPFGRISRASLTPARGRDLHFQSREMRWC